MFFVAQISFWILKKQWKSVQRVSASKYKSISKGHSKRDTHLSSSSAWVADGLAYHFIDLQLLFEK